MNAETRKIPEHQAIYERVRDGVLFGELVPGQSVTLHGLVELVGAGMTPVREAVRRLCSEGALQVLGNRRVVVPVLTSDQISELTFARMSIEPELAARACANRDLSLIQDLSDIDTELDLAIKVGSIENYLVHNFRFHFRLYASAESKILEPLAHSLWLRSGPSSRVVCGRFGTAHLPDMHDQTLAALRNGDQDAVRSAIAEDIRQGMELIARALHDQVPD